MNKIDDTKIDELIEKIDALTAKVEPFTCTEFVAYALGIEDPWKYQPKDLLTVYNNWELI